jgi:hypothetical protein
LLLTLSIFKPRVRHCYPMPPHLCDGHLPPYGRQQQPLLESVL